MNLEQALTATQSPKRGELFEHGGQQAMLTRRACTDRYVLSRANGYHRELGAFRNDAEAFASLGIGRPSKPIDVGTKLRYDGDNYIIADATTGYELICTDDGKNYAGEQVYGFKRADLECLCGETDLSGWEVVA